MIEVNPRLASQFSDLPMRAIGVDPPTPPRSPWPSARTRRRCRAAPVGGRRGELRLPRLHPAPGPPHANACEAARWRHETPDGLLLVFPKRGRALARDFKWLGSHRFGVIHLGGRDRADLRERCLAASARIGWHPPYAATGDAPLPEGELADPGWPLPVAPNPRNGPMMTTLRTRQLTSLALLHLAITLSGCSPMVAQNPDTGLKPVNAVADGDDQRVLLTAHDPVAYFTEGRHRLGSSEHSSLYQGVRLRFASAEQKAPLDADPTQYLPPFGGYCANAIVCGIPWGGDADTWLIEDDRL